MNNPIKKGVVVSVILLFIGMCVVPSTAVQELREKPFPINFDGNTLYVGGSGANNYTTIQSAIDNASDGDTVFVYDDSAPYYENVVVNKSINLIGEDRESTIIDADFYGIPIKITENKITVSGFTIQNSGDDYDSYSGILIDGLNENIISENKFINNYRGVYLAQAQNNTICDNIFTNNIRGIHLNGNICDFNRMTTNYFSDNDYGIYIHQPYRNYVCNNIFDNNTFGIRLRSTYGNIVTGNTITNSSTAIHFFFAERNLIESNNILNNDCGLDMEDNRVNIIKKNNFIENTCQVKFFIDSFLHYISLLVAPKNVFWRNYWDDNNILTPKLIVGKFYHFFVIINIFIYLFGLNNIPYLEMIERNAYCIDLFPARQPYDI